MDDFKNYPQTITEHRAEEKRNGELWTPRDVLINLLRDIDNGMKVDTLVVFYRRTDDCKACNNHGRSTNYCQSAPDPWALLGVVEMGKDLLLRSG